MSSSNKPSAHLLKLPEKAKGRGNGTEKVALARWENEGGAGSPDTLPTVLAAEEADVLHSLGSSVLALWSELPTAIQRELFNSALAGKEKRDPAKVKWQIARFLHLRAQGSASA